MLIGLFTGAALLAGCQKPEDTEIVVGSGGAGGGEPAGSGGIGVPDDVGTTEATGGASGAGGAVMVMVEDAGADSAVVPEVATTADVAPVDLPGEVVVVPPPPPPPDAGIIKVTVPGYAGGPFNNTPQPIPGTIQCALFDVGGEGIAYHDTDVVDLGIAFGGGPAAGLRPGESVDVGFTMNPLDRDPAQTPIAVGQPYIGWTHIQEWLKYTVTVRETGRYVISAMMSSIVEGSQVSFSFENGATTGPRLLPWTRGAHSWMVASNIGAVDLTAGLHVLMLRFEVLGQNNFEYLTFARVP